VLYAYLPLLKGYHIHFIFARKIFCAIITAMPFLSVGKFDDGKEVVSMLSAIVAFGIGVLSGIVANYISKKLF